VKKALGRGLDALIPVAGEEIIQVETLRIFPNPEQPRKVFGEDALKSLAASIRQKGIIQPVLVTRTGDGTFKLIAGERRWRAATLAGLEKVPCIVRKSSGDSLELALIENIQREDLNPIETAEAFKKLSEHLQLTQEALAEKVGKERATVANYMRLLNLSEPVKDFLKAGRMDMGHARALLSLTDKTVQEAAARKVLESDLSVRETEKLCRQYAETPPDTKAAKPPAKAKDPNIASLEEELVKQLGTKVRIHHKGKAGRIEIEYYSLEELDRLLEVLRSDTGRSQGKRGGQNGRGGQNNRDGSADGLL
jgi:ParB family chromosome partitioning protein